MYKAENIDTGKALKALDEARTNFARKCSRETKELQKYYEGIDKGLAIAEEIFYCSNYEKGDIENA